MSWMPSVSASSYFEEPDIETGPGAVAEHVDWHGAVGYPVCFAEITTYSPGARDTPSAIDAAGDDDGYGQVDLRVV